MIDFRIAVKGLLVHDQKLLLLQRSSTDVHKPGEWDIPGGRLEAGENPFDGVKREIEEETGINAVEILLPVQIDHFTRDDGQQITMIIFLCKSSDDQVSLSKDHSNYRWVDGQAALDQFPDWLHPAIITLHRFNLLAVE